MEENAVSSRVCLGVMASLLVYWVQICPEVWSESREESLKIAVPLTGKSGILGGDTTMSHGGC